MTRREEHFDAMLRHLGATYYQTVHGGATASDVARALEAVETEEEREPELAGAAARHASRGHPAAPARAARAHRWRVRDVMTADVVAVDKTTQYKQVARLMEQRRVNAVPVLTKGRRVVGIVSEADVLRKEERSFRRLGTGLPLRTRTSAPRRTPAPRAS